MTRRAIVGTPPLARLPALDVLTARHRFQVRRVDAGPVAAGVVDLYPRGDWPLPPAVAHPMRGEGAPAVPDAPIPILVQARSPLPAAIGRFDHFGPVPFEVGALSHTCRIGAFRHLWQGIGPTPYGQQYPWRGGLSGFGLYARCRWAFPTSEGLSALPPGPPPSPLFARYTPGGYGPYR